jgi:hypothetical protein
VVLNHTESVISILYEPDFFIAVIHLNKFKSFLDKFISLIISSLLSLIFIFNGYSIGILFHLLEILSKTKTIFSLASEELLIIFFISLIFQLFKSAI